VGNTICYVRNMGVWVRRDKKRDRRSADSEQIYLTPPSILGEYAEWYDPAPHPRPDGFDGLAVSDWGERAFVNPPWRNIRPWIEKALAEQKKGCRVHMLLPANPCTCTFQDLIFPHATVEWVRGRVDYLRYQDGVRVGMSSCIAKFEPAAPHHRCLRQSERRPHP